MPYNEGQKELEAWNLWPYFPGVSREFSVLANVRYGMLLDKFRLEVIVSCGFFLVICLLSLRLLFPDSISLQTPF